ncbi:Serine--tRNA ligase, mitochondrial, partial [Cytospora mali]
ADTKGLYRVHEFTKVELFAWTRPGDEAAEVFDEMLDMQTEILGSLGLHCRVLEMPSGDLGASATRKNDIEAWFPSRARRDNNNNNNNNKISTGQTTTTPPDEKTEVGAEEEEGWGEVTSASICTDYQTRRLATRVRLGGALTYPWTVNGTALAVPRVLAALLENGWDEETRTVAIPEVLRPYMDGMEKIGPKNRFR